MRYIEIPGGTVPLMYKSVAPNGGIHEGSLQVHRHERAEPHYASATPSRIIRDGWDVHEVEPSEGCATPCNDD